MNLSFKTKWPNGTPTYFVEKIWAGLINDGASINDLALQKIAAPGNLHKCLPSIYAVNIYPLKIHTVREDKTGRWKAGNKIHFFINPRTKDMYRFAPVIPCISTQDIFMTNTCDGFEVSVDKSYLYYNEIEMLAALDGFDSSAEFYNYFFPKNCKHDEWSGKIIHWTNFKY